MATFQEALLAAEQAAWTQPPPKTLKGKVNFLVRSLGRAHGTRLAAELLDVTPRTIQRYRKGTRKHPPAAIAARIDAAVLARWQPGVRRRAAARGAAHGVTLSFGGFFGYSSSEGGTSSEDGRPRQITRTFKREWAHRILDAHARQVSEDELMDLFAEALQVDYFQDNGSRADGLGVKITNLEYADIAY